MSNSVPAGAIQHAVLFHFPRPLAPDEEAEMADLIRQWPERIGGFTRLRFGPDRSGRSRGYGYLLLAEFAGEEAMRAYFPHPVHQAFGEWVHSRGSEELAFDYVLDRTTSILEPVAGA